MRITVAHSPDSDDAFMFYGLASGAVDTGGLEVGHLLADIETLNRAAFEGTYEVTAVSFHAYAHLHDRYILLPHGASMGENYGPIVVAREDGPSSLDGVRVAVPGLLTSAYLALRLYDPAVDIVVMPFDEIQDAVRRGDVAAGLLIHEGQLTYQDEGLRKIVDLGEWWAGRTGGLPLPLGGNVIRRDLGPEMIARVSRMLHASIKHALDNREKAARIRDAVRPRARPGQGRPLRRDVREQPHAGLHRRQPARRAAASSTKPTRRASSRRASPSNSPEREPAMKRRDFLIGAASSATPRWCSGRQAGRCLDSAATAPTGPRPRFPRHRPVAALSGPAVVRPAGRGPHPLQPAVARSPASRRRPTWTSARATRCSATTPTRST